MPEPEEDTDLDEFSEEVEDAATGGTATEEVRDPGKVLRALERKKRELQRARERLDAYGDATPDEITALKREVAELRETREKAEESNRSQWETERLGYERKMKEQTTTHDTEMTKLRNELHQEKVVSRGRRDLTAADIDPDFLDLAELYVSNRVKMEKDKITGKYVPVVKDARGETRLSPDPESSELMSISELVEEMKSKTHKKMFRYDGRSGGGSLGSGARDRTPKPGVTKIPRSDREAIKKHEEGIRKGTHVVVPD